MNNPGRNNHRIDRAVKNWRAKIEEQQASGEQPGVFCRQRNICSSGFYAWRKRLGMKEPAPDPVMRGQSLLPGPLKPLPGAGFLRLDPAGAAILKNPRFLNAKPMADPRQCLRYPTGTDGDPL